MKKPPRTTKKTVVQQPGRAARLKAARPATAMGAAERELLERLAERTSLSTQEVLSRALSSYAAAVAPELAAPGEAGGAGKRGKTVGRAAAKPMRRLFYSVDGGPERQVDRAEFVIGRDPGSDLHLDLPLIAPRHARLSWADGRWLFEDLKSPRGSYKGGQPVQVAFLETGDEIDLGGFLPIRFRMEG
jgi:hypothetical protein